jgi:catechol 2,3-dioxygenase-like lactoylglutathione lyase family enzyme
MVAFYEDVLGMKSGKRPNFPSHGAWIYVGNNPIIHLVETAHEDTLVERKVKYTLDPVPGLSVIQVNLTDVDGNHIHIDFNSTETEFSD